MPQKNNVRERTWPMTPTNLDRMTPDPPDADGTQPSIETVAAFIGPAATGYLKHYSKIWNPDRRSSASIPAHPRRFRLSWHWPAFVLTVPWMFYRKMYTGAIILVALPVFLDHILPGSLFLGSGLLVAATVGCCGKSWYLEHVVNRFAKAKSNFSDTAERTVYLQRAGGVSVSAGIFGVVIQTVTATVIILGLLPPAHF